jgi:preprotein translocase subunit YajC
MISIAYAADAASGGTMGMLMSIAPLILIFVIFYFLLIMPQQKKAKQHREMLSKIDKGDDVVTTGGIHGKVVGVAENVLTIEIAQNVKIKVSREFITFKKGSEDSKAITKT